MFINKRAKHVIEPDRYKRNVIVKPTIKKTEVETVKKEEVVVPTEEVTVNEEVVEDTPKKTTKKTKKNNLTENSLEHE